LPVMRVPYSSLASPESRQNFIEFTTAFRRLMASTSGNTDINQVRQVLDDLLMRPGVDRLRAIFPVTLAPQMIGGVQTDVITPDGGVATKNRQRVLINLHGGGMMVGARYGGQQESIPIASLGRIKVITVDYREGPEFKFPAASASVEAVYRELLRRYRPANIGIYGCSSGSLLAAETIAWFQAHRLPQPGAIGLFGEGAVIDLGESQYVQAGLMGWAVGGIDDSANPYFDVPGLDVKGPLISPGYWPSVLAAFPPTLLITGTRDVGLSSVVYTHSQLVKARKEASLHVWEGAPHCSFAQPVIDPAVPETREAWDVIIRFFDKHLGSKAKAIANP
jgi:monoterpene epsilon-lactone hydrolase